MTKKPAYQFGELSKAQQDCLTLIESLGIYELRALARVFGDNSPTTLKRSDHIEIVMNKIISGEDLKPIPLRQGRPYKELSNIEGILAELSQIAGKDYNLKSNSQRSTSNIKKIVTFRQMEETVYSQKMFPIEVRGILTERNEKEYILINQDNGKIILVRKDFDERLKPYDYITGSAVIMNSEKDYMIDVIRSINYQRFETYQDISNPYNQSIPNKKLSVDKGEITLGSRYLLKQSKFCEKANEIKNLLKKLNENKIITMALIPNVMYEDFNTINSLGFNNSFIIQYDERPLAVFEILTNFIEHVKRLQEQGKNVALFIEDITTIANSVDFAFKNNTKALMGHTEAAVDAIKNLMLLAKDGSDNKHTTIFTTLDDADLFDQMYVSSIYKISKKIEL